MSVIQFKTSKVTGVGSALIDLLIHENDAFLEMFGKEKGGMTLVEDRDIEAVLKKTEQQPAAVPGGAACNTIAGIAMLGGKAGFIAKRGDDGYGKEYEENLKNVGVVPSFYTSGTPTGKVLSVITPDAQRSMFTCLGASTELAPAEVTPDLFKGTGIAVIEGYLLLLNRDLVRASLDAAKAAGALVVLDLSSFEVVRASRDVLPDIVKKDVDILIANEDEARVYTGFSDEIKAVEALSEHVKIAVLKVGARGSYISSSGEVMHIKAVKADGGEIMDTTGAGDLWAAGFLYGIANGFSLKKSGQLASVCGFEVCRVQGAWIPEDAWCRIRKI